MKKIGLLTLFCSFFVTTLTLAQIDNLGNVSAEWIRTPARNAATDAGDIVIYNPAGLVRLNDGFTINIGNQSMSRKPTHSYDLGLGNGPQSFTQKGNDYLLPNFYASYKKDNFALFSGMFLSGGGGTLNYPSGSITTDLIGLQGLMAAQGAYGSVSNQYIKATSTYLTTTLGMSYAMNNRFSIAFAGRYLNAKNTTKAGMTFTNSPIGLPDAPYTLNTEDNATGAGGVISMMYKATPKFDVTMRYETAVKLDFKTTQHHDDFGVTTDGAKNRRDLPAVFAIGTAWSANSITKVYGDFNYYFQKDANWGTSTAATNNKSWSSMAGDAATIALATTIQPTKKLLVSFGTAYSKFMYSDRNGYYTKPGAYEVMAEDNVNVNTGFSYRATKELTLTLAYMHVFYKTQDTKALNAQPMDVEVKVKNSANVIGIGANIQF